MGLGEPQGSEGVPGGTGEWQGQGEQGCVGGDFIPFYMAGAQ